MDSATDLVRVREVLKRSCIQQVKMDSYLRGEVLE
jgi:hypothetical protein